MRRQLAAAIAADGDDGEPLGLSRIGHRIDVPLGIVVDQPDELIDHEALRAHGGDRKSTRLNSSHLGISYAVFCLKKKNNNTRSTPTCSECGGAMNQRP